jgi:hypothetical protein
MAGLCLFAHPTLDRNCVSCHPSLQNRFELLDFQKTLSNLRVYTVTQGSIVSISINITNGAQQHATIDPAVPPDLYRGTAQVAGLAGTTGWGQEIDFFLEVLPAPDTNSSILNPVFANAQFSCSLSTATGTTYFLEYKSSLDANTWTVIGRLSQATAPLRCSRFTLRAMR